MLAWRAMSIRKDAEKRAAELREYEAHSRRIAEEAAAARERQRQLRRAAARRPDTLAQEIRAELKRVRAAHHHRLSRAPLAGPRVAIGRRLLLNDGRWSGRMGADHQGQMADEVRPLVGAFRNTCMGGAGASHQTRDRGCRPDSCNARLAISMQGPPRISRSAIRLEQATRVESTRSCSAEGRVAGSTGRATSWWPTSDGSG